MTTRDEMGLKATELPRFNIRMPKALRQELEREAKIHGRSLNQEIIDRLSKSCQANPDKNDGTLSAQEPTVYGPRISDADRQMLSIFQRFTPEKQLALISLFK